MTPRLRQTLYLLLRIILGGIFLYAGVLKVGDSRSFAGTIAAYQILPYFLNVLTASILPWWEILLGLLLVTGFRVKTATFSLFCINLVFTVALAAAMARGLDIDCGCFGKETTKTPLFIPFLRDILFLAMAAAIFRLAGERKLAVAEPAPK